MVSLERSASRTVDKLPRSRICSSALCMLLACALLVPCVSMSCSHPALASDGKVKLWKTGNINYTDGDWNAHMFMADDGSGSTRAYCVEPDKNSPAAGSYDKSDIHCISGRDYELKVDLWFAFGGPGFDASMWPALNWDGQPMSDRDYYLASHILLADTYSSNAFEATHGAGEIFRDWIVRNVTGFDLQTSEVVSPDAVGRRAWDRKDEVPSNFFAFQIDGGNAQTIVTFSHYVPLGTMKIDKRSTNPEITEGNECYSMKGIVYGIYLDEGCTPQSDTGERLVLDENGYAELPGLYRNEYFVREIEASVMGTGYAYDPTPLACVVEAGKEAWVRGSSSQPGDGGERPPADDPITYDVNVLIQKHDILTHSSTPSGDGSLANAVFEVRYFDNLRGEATGIPTRTWTFKTDEAGRVDLRNALTDAFVSGDDLYRDPLTRAALFPLGTYSVHELTAPACYEPPLAQKPIIVTLTANGTGAHDVDAGALTYEGLVVDEMPVRHDLSFTKRDLDTQRPMPLVPFLVSRVAKDGSLIESHVAVTDANGMFSSSSDRALHTTRTNANDDALATSANGSPVIREDRLDPDAGIWFGIAQDGSWLDPDDEAGAFPDSVTCKYVFDELPVSANEGKALVRFEARAHGARSSTIDLGTVGNTTPTLATVACDGLDGDKLISMDAGAWILDAVSYTGLVAGRTYTLRGSLVNANDATPLRDAHGNPYVSEARFTAPASSGNLDMDFFFDTSNLAGGDKVVVCEKLYEGERLLTTHDDWLDSSQTVTIVEPAIQTQACDALDGDSTIVADVDARVVDHVSYTGLIAGDAYTLTATLMDPETGQPFSDENGIVTAGASFVPEGPNGKEAVTLAFDASGLRAGKKLSVFERLFKNGRLVASHEDLNDAYQTVIAYPPSLRTRASDPIDGDAVIAADTRTQLIDTVEYKDLAAGREYELHALLVDKETGQPLLDPFERRIEATHAFTPLARDGQIDVTLEFDASHIKSTRGAVVFEELHRAGKLVASHIDINSSEQFIAIEPPAIQTFASADGSSKSIMRDASVSLRDEISYRNLKVGASYRLVGSLVVKRTGSILRDENGNPIESILDFTPHQTSGMVTMDFSFDATSLSEGDELVACETLLRDGAQVIVHDDPEDARQTIVVAAPRISTYASSLNGSKDLVRDYQVTVNDVVSYQGLAPDCEYELIGTLMDASTGAALVDAQGREVTARTSFVPASSNGNVTQTFAFDASLLEYGQRLVAFETLERNGKRLAAHADIEDADQTVTVVPISIQTYASDPADGDKVVAAHSQTKVLDMVSYDGLEAGAEYEFVGTLMGVESQEPLLTAQGNPARARRAFTPQASRGTIDVVFAFDASDKAQQQDAVIVQELYRDDVLLASHDDLHNVAQTVTVAPVRLSTYASDGADGDKEIRLGSLETITDSVAYTGLTPGQRYELHGKLVVDIGTLGGEPLRDALGKPVESYLAFTPDSTQGTVNLNFDVDTSILWDNVRIVAFEELLCEQTPVATHQDLRDEDQAVRVVSIPAPSPPEEELPELLTPLATPLSIGKMVNTGDAGARLLLACSAIGLAAFAALCYLRRKAFGDVRSRK